MLSLVSPQLQRECDLYREPFEKQFHSLSSAQVLQVWTFAVCSARHCDCCEQAPAVCSARHCDCCEQAPLLSCSDAPGRQVILPSTGEVDSLEPQKTDTTTQTRE